MAFALAPPLRPVPRLQTQTAHPTPPASLAQFRPTRAAAVRRPLHASTVRCARLPACAASPTRHRVPPAAMAAASATTAAAAAAVVVAPLPPPLSSPPPSSPPPPPPPPPLLTVLSTIVGVCVLIGSVLYKLPQVVRVVRRRSAAGISVLMYALETVGTTFSAVYFARRAFPFATYGEAVFIMVQNVLLMGLIVAYQRLPRVPAAVCAVLYAGGVVVLYSKVVPMKVVMALQVCSIPVLNLARVPQIWLNWRRKSTGELSPITLGLQLLGNAARIFTTVAQVRDPLMFVAICVATCFNGTLFGQWLYYSRKQRKLVNQLPNA